MGNEVSHQKRDVMRKTDYEKILHLSKEISQTFKLIRAALIVVEDKMDDYINDIHAQHASNQREI